MKYGWITINITDMWLKPQYNSERVNQMFFMDFCIILDEKNNFCLVEKYDKYQGWVDKRFIESCSLKSYKEFTSKKNYIVTAKTLVAQNKNIQHDAPHFLFYGTLFFATKVKINKLKISLPNSSSLLVSTSGVDQLKKKEINATSITKEAKKFLGVPYLWGGITSVGIDCSGFTQTVLSRFGVQIPRDTKDQIQLGREILRENIKTGDLLFFNRHVGFAIGKNKIIHSSVGGGGVKINSLVPSMSTYRQDLDESFKTARRII